MFIERYANMVFSSVGAASVSRGCRSYGARTHLSSNSYKHCAPTERENLCRYHFEKLFVMAVHDVGTSFINELKSLGYDKIPVDKLIAMRIHRVDANV